MCCFYCNHRVFSCVDYVANNEREVGLFGIVRSSAEALTTRPANEVLCVWSSCLHVCMCVCVCTFRFEVPLCIVISGLLNRASDIFRYLKLLRTRNACHANPERERESIWSNSNTDAAPVDLSIFVSLPLLLWTVLRSTVSSCFFNGSSRWRMF